MQNTGSSTRFTSEMYRMTYRKGPDELNGGGCQFDTAQILREVLKSTHSTKQSLYWETNRQ